MLEDKNVNLRLMEKEYVLLFVEWWNSLESQGEYFPVLQKSKTQALQEAVCQNRSINRNRVPVTIRDSQHFYIIFSSYPRGNLNMVNCPECGKPLKKSTRKAKYCCENSACSVIFVRHPDKQSIMEITYKARARS
jgi:hypothetical protein